MTWKGFDPDIPENAGWNLPPMTLLLVEYPQLFTAQSRHKVPQHGPI